MAKKNKKFVITWSKQVIKTIEAVDGRDAIKKFQLMLLDEIEKQKMLETSTDIIEAETL